MDLNIPTSIWTTLLKSWKHDQMGDLRVAITLDLKSHAGQTSSLYHHSTSAYKQDQEDNLTIHGGGCSEAKPNRM